MKKKKILTMMSVVLVVVVIATAIGIVIDDKIFNEKYSLKYVFVCIKSEYKEKYLAEEITIEDFNWDNIDNIEYAFWSYESNHAWIYVYLKKQSPWAARRAMRHFESLDFVEFVELHGPIQVKPVELHGLIHLA